MFNPTMGAIDTIDGRAIIRTAPGLRGHAIYGPYARLAPGRYTVEFMLSRADAAGVAGNPVAAVLDVVRDAGTDCLASKQIRFRDIGDDRGYFALTFDVDRPSDMEYRVYVTGEAALAIDGYRRIVPLDRTADAAAALERGRFPENAPHAPFFAENRALFRQLHERGVDVALDGDDVVLTIAGVRFNARVRDDLNFIDELFFQNAYTIALDREVCVIDIGMNIGLASLRFAARPEVRRVIAFEPFATTYARAAANVALNPALAAKIEAINCGLGDRTEERVVTVPQTADSGAMSTIDVAGGTPIAIRMRDAAETLAPMIARAEADGLKVIVKVDCEGSEFAIFESLERAGLFGRIDAFLVEWHAMFAGKTQETLIAPLRRAGFITFDRSPPVGNGFFYAARMA